MYIENLLVLHSAKTKTERLGNKSEHDSRTSIKAKLKAKVMVEIQKRSE